MTNGNEMNEKDESRKPAGEEMNENNSENARTTLTLKLTIFFCNCFFFKFRFLVINSLLNTTGSCH